MDYEQTSTVSNSCVHIGRHVTTMIIAAALLVFVKYLEGHLGCF